MLRKITVLFISLLTFGLLGAPNALASRDLIVFKTNAPLEVPGRVLAPGKYTVVNLDTTANSGVIEIQNSRGKAVGDFLTEPVARASAVGHTVLKLQKEANSPDRIRYFIPAGNSNGYSFIYPTAPVETARTNAGAVINTNG